MTTPHFALAQHPESGQWAVHEWHGGHYGWMLVTWSGWRHERIDALTYLRSWLEPIVPSNRADADELDRLIAIERDHAAGDEAHIQTIRALEGDAA